MNLRVNERRAASTLGKPVFARDSGHERVLRSLTRSLAACPSLQEVESRLFSEGLHVLGQPPSPAQMEQYLGAYFDGALPDEAVGAVAQAWHFGGISCTLPALAPGRTSGNCLLE